MENEKIFIIFTFLSILFMKKGNNSWYFRFVFGRKQATRAFLKKPSRHVKIDCKEFTEKGTWICNVFKGDVEKSMNCLKIWKYVLMY